MIEQCPCVKPPNSDKCLSYDNRLQAANIDEALHTFPDLSSMTEMALPLVSDENSIMMKSTAEFSPLQKIVTKRIFDIIMQYITKGREGGRVRGEEKG